MTLALNVEHRLSKSTDTIKQTIQIVWSAYRSVLSKEGHLVYVSTAISSGKRMYDVLQQLGCSYDELKNNYKEVLYKDIIQPNIEAGTALAKKLAQHEDAPVVAPAIFEAHSQRWSQDEYMGMWLKMIEDNVGQMVMSPGWEYSNGGAEEYLLAMQMAYGLRSKTSIRVQDSEGNLMPLHRGLELIAQALLDLHNKGLKASSLASVYTALNNTKQAWSYLRTEFNREMVDSVNESILTKVNKDIIPLLQHEYDIEQGSWGVTAGEGLNRELTSLPENVLIVPNPIES